MDSPPMPVRWAGRFGRTNFDHKDQDAEVSEDTFIKQDLGCMYWIERPIHKAAPGSQRCGWVLCCPTLKIYLMGLTKHRRSSRAAVPYDAAVYSIFFALSYILELMVRKTKIFSLLIVRARCNKKKWVVAQLTNGILELQIAWCSLLSYKYIVSCPTCIRWSDILAPARPDTRCCMHYAYPRYILTYIMYIRQFRKLIYIDLCMYNTCTRG